MAAFNFFYLLYFCLLVSEGWIGSHWRLTSHKLKKKKKKTQEHTTWGWPTCLHSNRSCCLIPRTSIVAEKNNNICIKKNIRIRWNLVLDKWIDIWYFFSSLSSSWVSLSIFLKLFDYWVKIFKNYYRWYLKILEKLLRKNSFGIAFGGK